MLRYRASASAGVGACPAGALRAESVLRSMSRPSAEKFTYPFGAALRLLFRSPPPASTIVPESCFHVPINALPSLPLPMPHSLDDAPHCFQRTQYRIVIYHMTAHCRKGGKRCISV